MNTTKWTRGIHWSLALLLALLPALGMGLLSQPPAVRADTLTVANANDSGTGSLRAAIAAAQPGDTIVFAPALAGQTITLASQLVISRALTIDGSSLSTPVTLSGNDAVRVFHVYTDTHATLDSLTIAHGKTTAPDLYGYYATGGGVMIESGAAVTLTHSAVLSNTSSYYDTEWDEYYGCGGGVYNLGALVVIDSTFAGNVAGNPAESGDSYGGAIYDGGTLAVTGSTFTGNTAMTGGAIYDGGTLAVTGSTFTGNTAMMMGGAIYSQSGATLTVQNSTFSSNSAPCGGAGISSRGTATVSGSTIADNVAPGSSCEGDAAGIGNRGTMTVTHSIISGNVSEGYYGGLSNYDGTLTVLDSAIYSNTADDHGGGIYNWWGATLTVINSAIYSNTAGWWGGGIFSGPDGGASLTLINSAIYGNTAEQGGGIYNGSPYNNSGAVLTMINSTVVSNTATSAGGGLYNKDAAPTVINTILWNNVAPTGPQVYLHNITTVLSPTIRYSDIEGCGGSGAGWDDTLGSDGGGNIDADPLFANAAHGDLRLPLTSPAVDAGDNGAVPAGITTDLAGSPRIVNGVVDMGAYEAIGLVLAKSVTPGEAVPYHGVVTFTLVLHNDGLLSDPAVTLTDTLPAGISFASWVISPTNTVRAGNAIIWTGALAPGEVLTWTWRAMHTGDYGDAITNTAHVSGTWHRLDAEAAFQVNPAYTITPTAGAGGSISPAAPQTVEHGSSITFAITPDAGYHVADVLVDGSSIGAVTSYTFENVAADHVISAAFALNEYTLTVSVVGQGDVTRAPSQTTYLHGEVVTLTALPASGWLFGQWGGDASGTLTETAVTMDGHKSITATFLQENQPPAADAGSSQTVRPGALVTLDGSASSDAGGGALTYLWQQTGGPTVTLNDPTASRPTFIAPGTPGVLIFTLTVTDSGGLSSQDTVEITVALYTIYLPLVMKN